MNFGFELTASNQTTAKRLLAGVGVSHRLWQKIVRANLLWVAGVRGGNQPVVPGTVVRFELPPATGLAPNSGSLRIVADLADWLIIDKPAGLSSVPGPSTPTDSVANRAAGWLVAQGYTGPQPAVMTRLDRDTTGLVLVAKHPWAQGRLDASDSRLDKIYRGVVVGHPSPAADTIRLPLKKAADGVHMVPDPAGLDAETSYQVVAETAEMSLVAFRLHTGRTHQIRVHMQAVGTPLVGDPLYGQPTPAFSHQLLQAARLTFTDPFDGQTHTFALPVPVKWPTFTRGIDALMA